MASINKYHPTNLVPSLTLNINQVSFGFSEAQACCHCIAISTSEQQREVYSTEKASIRIAWAIFVCGVWEKQIDAEHFYGGRAAPPCCTQLCCQQALAAALLRDDLIVVFVWVWKNVSEIKCSRLC